MRLSSLQFSSVQPLDRLGRWGGHCGRFSRDPLPVLPAEDPCDQFWHGQGCPLFDVVHPAFPLPTKASPTFQDALKDSFEEAAMAHDMSEPCKILSLDKYQKRFLWTNKEVDLASHQAVGLWLQGGDREKFPLALGLKAWIKSQQAGSMFHSHREGWR